MSTNGERAAKYLEQVAKMVLEKGKAYGDSVGNPVRIFSKADQKEGLRVRIDDKLSRIARGNPDTDQEDNIKDLIGYLALFATNQDPDGSAMCKVLNITDHIDMPGCKCQECNTPVSRTIRGPKCKHVMCHVGYRTTCAYGLEDRDE